MLKNLIASYMNHAQKPVAYGARVEKHHYTEAQEDTDEDE